MTFGPTWRGSPTAMLNMVKERPPVTLLAPMTPAPARDRLIVLDRDECLGHLKSGGVGRVAVSVGALPAIFPVNYAMLEDDIVFRVGPGTSLDTAVDGAVVAFEIDDSDATCHTGWTVLVVGEAQVITDPGTLDRATHLPLAPWADGVGGTFVQLAPALVSGRQVAECAQVGPWPEAGSGS